MRTAHTVEIAVNVDDREALWEHAFGLAIGDCGLSKREARGILGTRRKPDVSACLCWAFDPGISPPGTSIQSSECDEGMRLD